MQNNITFSTNTLIIGGGPAGSTLARLLNNGLIDNILIEKNLNFDKPCGGGIKSIVFNEFNIPKNLETKKITIFNLLSKKEKVSINLSKTPISIVLRKEFDKNLRNLAKESGTKLIEGKYISSEFFDNSIISKIKIENDYLFIKSKYLVAADGVNSSVRKVILNSQTNSLLTNYTLIENQDINYCDFYFGKDYSKNEYTWIFPHGNKLSLGSVLKDNSAKSIFKEFKHKLYKNGKIKGYYIPKWNNEKIFYKNKTFFVGDAAGQILPFTYEGIYFAMKSAQILSQSIINDSPETYEKVWNDTYLKKFKFFRFMQKIFLSNDYFVNLLLKLFKNEKIQKKALDFWEGTKEPISTYKIPFRLIKTFLKK